MTFYTYLLIKALSDNPTLSHLAINLKLGATQETVSETVSIINHIKDINNYVWLDFS